MDKISKVFFDAFCTSTDQRRRKGLSDSSGLSQISKNQYTLRECFSLNSWLYQNVWHPFWSWVLLHASMGLAGLWMFILQWKMALERQLAATRMECRRGEGKQPLFSEPIFLSNKIQEQRVYLLHQFSSQNNNEMLSNEQTVNYYFLLLRLIPWRN